jgi:hypothetical protein
MMLDKLKKGEVYDVKCHKIFNISFCLFILLTRIIQTYTMMIWTLNGGSWDETPNMFITNQIVYWMEPGFFFIDAIILIIALTRIYFTFKGDRALMVSEYYMIVHIGAVLSLAVCSIMKVYNFIWSTNYLLYSTMYITVDFLSCLTLAWIMFKVSGKRVDSLEIGRGPNTILINSNKNR